MGVSLTGLKWFRRALAASLAGLALFALSVGGSGAARLAGAASCAEVELQPAGSLTLSSCGAAALQRVASSVNEAHFATGANRAGGAIAAQQPGANAHFSRSGQASAPAGGASAASVGELPPRKTIDLTRLPAGLVAPSK